MARQVRLEEVLQQGGSKELATLHESAIPVGREPEGGIRLENPAVSRTHGVFIPVRNHWIYRDLGSTNGSWVNGTPVYGGRSRIIRIGDTIQLADVFLRLSSVHGDVDRSEGGQKSPRSLLVFKGEDFVEEYPVPEFGKALVIGGTGADLQISGVMKDRPSLVVETRGDRLCAYRVDKDVSAQLNGSEITESLFLKDGDEIIVNEYSILFNDVSSPEAAMRSEAPLTPKVRDWTEEQSGVRSAPSYRPAGGTVFGSQPLEGDSLKTVTISGQDVESKLKGFERPSMGFDDDFNSPYDEGLSLEQKLYIFIGVTLLTTVLLLVFWWLG